MSTRNKVIYWISTIWLSTGILSTGALQVLHAKDGPGGADSIARLGYPLYFLTIIGIWKVLGVIAILIPRFPLLKEWAYAGLFFAMSGAVLSHVASGTTNEMFPSAALTVMTILSWYFRPPDRKPVPVIR